MAVLSLRLVVPPRPTVLLLFVLLILQRHCMLLPIAALVPQASSAFALGVQMSYARASSHFHARAREHTWKLAPCPR